MVDHTLFACTKIVRASVAVSFHAAENSGPDKRGSVDMSCFSWFRVGPKP